MRLAVLVEEGVAEAVLHTWDLSSTKGFNRGWISWGSGPYCRFDPRMEYFNFLAFTVQDGVVEALVPTWVLSIGWSSSILRKKEKNPPKKYFKKGV